MPRRLRLLLTLSLIVPALGHAVEGDWGSTHDLYIRKNLNEKWFLAHRSQANRRDDFSDFYFALADIGIGYRFLPGWSVEAAYRQTWLESSGSWRTEDRPHLNLAWTGNVHDVTLYTRSRLEFREYRWDKEDDIRWRQQVRIDLPWEILPYGIKPYVEEESFWERNVGKFDLNWLTGGLYCKLYNHMKVRLGYRWVAARVGDGWENRNYLVTGLYLYY